MKKYLLMIFCAGLLMLQACNRFQEIPKTAQVLSKHFNNKLYNEFDTAAYQQVFLKTLDTASKHLSNPNTLRSFYEQRHWRTEFVNHHYVNGDIDSLLNYLGSSRVHGYNPEIFKIKQLQAWKSRLDANNFKDINEVYPVLAGLEISAAEALSKYHGLVRYGSLNPRKLLNRYYINVKRPDSMGIIQVLADSNHAALLKKIQPTSPQYKAFQDRLAALQANKMPDAKLKTILVNMERLRWQLPERGEEYVEVNIPDFSLTWHKGQDTLSHMKVCVGAKREKAYLEKLKVYRQSGKLSDKPKNHETPLMFSKFNSIQVNPIWNIPVSIAKTEIYYQARNDRYYLSNNNMRVYYKGQLVGDPDTIQWNRYSPEKLPFQFKQGSGSGNALGKFKFIFENGSSIYLHDTNNKSAFNKSNRAISHGCVRVERPLEFAALLVNDKRKFDNLRMEVNLPPLDTTRMAVFHKKQAKKKDSLEAFVLKPSWFGPKKQVPILINYTTAWWQNGVMQERADVYGLDEELWLKLKKFL